MKTIKKFFIVLLTAMLLLSSMGITAFAQQMTEQQAIPTMTTGSQVPFKGSYTFTQNDIIHLTKDDRIQEVKGIAIPLSFGNAGIAYFDFTTLNVNNKYINAELYSDTALSERVGSMYIGNAESKSANVHIAKAGVYYLALYVTSSDAFTATVDISASLYRTAQLTMKNGEYLARPGYNSAVTESVNKITLTAKGYVTVYSSADIYAKLLDSKKNEIRNQITLNEKNNRRVTYRLSKGTYYVVTKTYNNAPYKIKYAYASSFGSLTAGKYKSVFSDGKSSYDMAFKATKNGYIKVAGNPLSGYVTLLDSKQKAISDESYISSTSSSSYMKTAIFGVQKGKTYYIKFRPNVSGKQNIKVTITGVSDVSGASKAKAKTIKKKTTYKGTITAGSSVQDWYKLKTTKKGTFKLRITGRASGNGSVVIQVIPASSKVKIYGDTIRRQNSSTGTAEYTIKNMPAGTYYIRVYRGSAKSSGYYTINWTA